MSTKLPGSYLPLPLPQLTTFSRTFLCFSTFAADLTMSLSDRALIYIHLSATPPATTS